MALLQVRSSFAFLSKTLLTLLQIMIYVYLVLLSLPLAAIRNVTPEYVTCAGPDGQNAIIYTKAEIDVALEKA